MSSENEKSTKFIRLERVNLKRLDQLSEKHVQKQIASDPTILGLGELVAIDRERRQPKAGRLDLLLRDTKSDKRYEVEIQLGETDESHIIRTVEYWDLERKRYPQYEHAAVIVAEEITSRFLNVVQLFYGQIPLIALKMTAFRIGDDYALTFVKVLDELTFGPVDNDETSAERVDQSFWETDRGTKETLSLTDDLFGIVREVEPAATLNYTKHYIGLEVAGSAFNFVRFRPHKAHVRMMIKHPQDADIDEMFDEAGIDRLGYRSRDREYQVNIYPNINDSQRKALKRLLEQANVMLKKS